MPTMASKRDYYEVLGVSQEAGAAEIKSAYRKRALENHPDRNPGDEEAVARFKEASEAFEVLRDPEKRERYDRFGHEGVAANGGGFADMNDIFGAFGDIFGDLFGGGGPGTRGRRAQPGQSLRTAISIELIDAARGCERELDIERRELCSTCDGSGAKPGSTPQMCDYCGGHGRVIQSQGFFRVQTTCPACRGDGKIVREKCPACRGGGREVKSVKLQVTIPAGVDTGMRLCLRGEGEPGPGGGPRGDLYVDIHVQPHDFFQRDGTDLHCEVPLTYTQAALGTTLDIPLLEGKHTLKVPAGTQTGETFEVRREGLPDPHGGRPGDLIVTIHIDVPKKLSDEQEKLLRKLAEIEHSEVTPHRRSWLDKVKEIFTGEDSS